MNTNAKRSFDWPRILAFIGVTLSLIFVGIELQLSRTSAQMGYSGDSSNRSLEYRVALAEHADIWIRGCQGEELSDSEEFVFNSLVIAFMIEIQDSISRMITQGDSGDSVIFFTDLAALNVHHYKGIRRVFDTFLEWENLSSQRTMLNPEFVDSVRKRVRRLEVDGVEPSGDSNFCGVVW